MRKKILWGSISFGILSFMFFFLLGITPAYSAALMKFGGLEVTKTTAQPIKEKEDAGYTCIVPGQTFEGRLKGSPPGTPTSWLIMAGNIAPSKGNPTVKKNVILSYLSAAIVPIVCIRPPYDVAIVKLNSVNRWQVPGI